MRYNVKAKSSHFTNVTFIFRGTGYTIDLPYVINRDIVNSATEFIIDRFKNGPQRLRLGNTFYAELHNELAIHCINLH